MRATLTDAVIETLCVAVEGGTSVHLASEATGFTERAFYYWLKQGRTDIEAGRETVHARLVRRLARARIGLAAPLVTAALAQARDGADNRSALSLLKTFLPAHYGDRSLDVQQALDAAAQAVESAEAARAALVVRCNGCGTGTATDDRSTPPLYCAACGERFPPKEAPTALGPTEGA